jgi:glycolate oxidase FAD binding subunit
MRETLADAGGGAVGAETSAAPPAWWNRDPSGPGGTLLQVAYPPAALRTVLDAIGSAVEAAGTADPLVRGSAGMGVLAVGLDGAASPAAAGNFVATLRRLIAAHGRGPDPDGSRPGTGGGNGHSELPGGSVTVVHAPPELRDHVDMIGPVPALGLMRAVKDQFDPGHVMAPGRLTGGI